MKPLVSVLIPCRNQGHFLDQALESVMSQKGTEAEVIVVNDGSTDGTADVVARWIKRFPNRVRIMEGGGVGQARARRLASVEARGEYWVTLDADDGLFPHMMRSCLDALQRNPDAAGAVGDVVMTDAEGHRVTEILRQRGLSPWPFVLASCPIGAWNGVLLRADVVKKIGGIGLEGDAGAEDWDLAVRMVRAGYQVVPVGQVVAWYRQHPVSHSRNPLRTLLARLEMLERCRMPDDRLNGVITTQPILEDEVYRDLKNRMIFFALGVAAVVEPSEAARILSFLADGSRCERVWAKSYADGYAHAIRGELRPSGFVPPDVREALVAVCRNRWGWSVDEVGRVLLLLARMVRWRLFPGPRHWWRRYQALRLTRRFEKMRESRDGVTQSQEAKK